MYVRYFTRKLFVSIQLNCTPRLDVPKSFAHAGPSAWNSLPDDLRNTFSAFQFCDLN